MAWSKNLKKLQFKHRAQQRRRRWKKKKFFPVVPKPYMKFVPRPRPPIQWMNYFTNRLYVNRMDEVSWRFDIAWAMGSQPWLAWPIVPERTCVVRFREGWGVTVSDPIKTSQASSFLPMWFFRKPRQQQYLPARYLYLISAVWTPMYLLFFYLRKIKKTFPILLGRRRRRRRRRRVCNLYPNLLYTERLVQSISIYIHHNKRLREQNFSQYKEFRRHRFLDRRTARRLLARDAIKDYFYKWIDSFFYRTNGQFQKLFGTSTETANILTVRKSHRFGFKHLWSKFFYYQWARFALRFAFGQKVVQKQEGFVIPHKYRHTQRNPWRYYNQSRWDNKAQRWLTPLLYKRKLFPYQLLSCVTLQKRHPNRYKHWKPYKWFKYTLNNKWAYGMQSHKNYRLKQILFKHIVLPAFGAFHLRAYLRIKANAARIKPIGVINSRQAVFLGKFERRLDVLTYKSNVAATLQWARLFVESGFIYVSRWSEKHGYSASVRPRTKTSQLPLWAGWNALLGNYLSLKPSDTAISLQSQLATRLFPLPVTLSSYRIPLRSIIHWTQVNLSTWVYKKHIKRRLPGYILFNKSHTVGYFWRNLKLADIAILKRERLQKNTFHWLS